MGFFDRQTAAQSGRMSGQEMRQAFFKDAQGLKSDVNGYISRAGVNIPENIRNDPQAMAMHLINSGQVPRQRLQMLAPLLQRAGIRL